MKKKLIITLFVFLTLIFSCASVEPKQTEPIHPEEQEIQKDDIIEDKKSEEPTQISVNDKESQNAETSDYEQPSEAAASLEKELEPEELVKEQKDEEKKEPAEPEHNTEKEEVKKSTEAEKKTEVSVQPTEQAPKPEEKISTPEPEKQSHKEPEKKIEENKTESPKDKEDPAADEEKTVEEQPVETKEEAQNKEDSSLEEQSESVSSEEPSQEIPEKQAEAELPIKKEPEKKAEDQQSIQPPAETKEKKQQSPQFFSEFPDTEPEKEDKPVISKSLEVTKGQRLELSYPGEQWVYLGESTSKNGIKYIQRKLYNKQSVFTFLSETEGDYILNFSYFDAFSGDFVSDSVMVKVEQPKDSGSIQPAVAEHKMPEPKTEKETKKELTENNVPDTEKQILTETLENKITEKQPAYTNPVKEADPMHSSSGSIVEEEPDVLISSNKTAGKKAGKRSISIEEAKEALASGNGGEALKILTDFLQANSDREDEAWFLKGQVYELNGDTKNIKLALEAYKFLVKAFPQSNYWDEADARIRYIKKFYINIK